MMSQRHWAPSKRLWIGAKTFNGTGDVAASSMLTSITSTKCSLLWSAAYDETWIKSRLICVVFIVFNESLWCRLTKTEQESETRCILFYLFNFIFNVLSLSSINRFVFLLRAVDKTASRQLVCRTLRRIVSCSNHLHRRPYTLNHAQSISQSNHLRVYPSPSVARREQLMSHRLLSTGSVCVWYKAENHAS